MCFVSFSPSSPLCLLLLILYFMSVKFIELRKKEKEDGTLQGQTVYLLPMVKATERHINHLGEVTPCNLPSRQTPQSLLSIFQWAKWFMSSEVKHGPVYESKFVKLAFPTQVYELIQLRFEYESPESATLLLTDCSFSRAIKPFVFSHHPTIPPASARRWRALWKQRGGMIYYSN